MKARGRGCNTVKEILYVILKEMIQHWTSLGKREPSLQYTIVEEGSPMRGETCGRFSFQAP